MKRLIPVFILLLLHGLMSSLYAYLPAPHRIWFGIAQFALVLAILGVGIVVIHTTRTAK